MLIIISDYVLSIFFVFSIVVVISMISLSSMTVVLCFFVV